MARVLLALMLMGVYVAVLGSTHPLDLLTGFAVGLALVVVLRPTRPDELPTVPEERRPAPLTRAVWFPWLVVGLLRETALGCWDVGLRCVALRSRRNSGEVVVPFGERTEVGVAVTVVCFAFAPGGQLVRVDEAERTMTVHVMDGRDPDAVRASLERFYARYQRRVFP